MPGALDNCLHFSHYYVVRNAGRIGRYCPLDLGTEPHVIGGGVLASRELRLDAVWLRHAETPSLITSGCK